MTGAGKHARTKSLRRAAATHVIEIPGLRDRIGQGPPLNVAAGPSRLLDRKNSLKPNGRKNAQAAQKSAFSSLRILRFFAAISATLIRCAQITL
jgi:hypothetical protein